MRPSLSILLAAALAGGCTDGGAGEGGADCGDGNCDAAGDFFKRLEGRADPIAKFLRTLKPDNKGLIKIAYDDVVAGVTSIQGCKVKSRRAFVVSDPLVVVDRPFPRVVTTVCSDNPTKASEFFVAASFKHPKNNDVDDSKLEMFAWDPTAKIYRFYKTERAGSNKVELTVDPEECAGCHLAPTDLPTARSFSADGPEITTGHMRMTPIMNELTRPWSHWNSQVPMFNKDNLPFPSHEFDVPTAVGKAATFVRIGRDHAAQAQLFEDIIREGHVRVTNARNLERRAVPAQDWRPAMNLLRPLFCEEQVNYGTEDFDSGLLLVTTLIPGGMREAFNQLRPSVEPVEWPFRWLNNQDGRVRLVKPAQVPALFMVPVRGNADIDYENRMLASGDALAPIDVVRIRALDWKQPVFSDFRCNLWKTALERFEDKAPKIDPSSQNKARMRQLYTEIMKFEGKSLILSDARRVVALDRATTAVVDDLVDALGDGSIDDATCSATGGGFCSVDPTQLGELLDVYVTSFEDGKPDTVRKELTEERDRRLCHVMSAIPSAPALPPITCP